MQLRSNMVLPVVAHYLHQYQVRIKMKELHEWVAKPRCHVFGSYKQEVVSSYYSSFVGCKKKLSDQDT